MSLARRLIYIILFVLVSLPLSAQKTEQKDSLVRLMSAQSGELIEKNGISYRKITGPARFLHNGAYLICDTAIWNVNTNIINAIGNVKIIQDETVLSGDILDYFVDDDLAKFRGSLVQLQDKDKNTLRTHNLDYNTKDSVAVFQNGGAMKDKDGQIIESRTGTYDSKINLFTFQDDVNMFSDTTFIKTSRLTYNTDTGLATFTTMTDAWNKDNMISASGGWYDRAKEVFFFRGNVHAMSKDQEGWSDSLYYYRSVNDIDVLGHVQVIDTTRNVGALAGRIFYQDSTSTITMTRNPAVIIRQVTEEKTDTTWVGADTLIYRSVMMCDVDSLEVVHAKERTSDMESDPVTEYRRQGAEARAKAKAEADEINEIAKLAGMSRDAVKAMSAAERAEIKKQLMQSEETTQEQAPPAPDDDSSQPDDPDEPDEPVEPDDPDEPVEPDESVQPDQQNQDEQLALDKDVQIDSLSLPGMQLDSLATTAVDSLVTIEPPKDTTKIGFARGIGRVRVFRSDLQVACDSLVYNDLDSLARLYKNPIIWNDANRQYKADSVAVLIKNQTLDKARLMSDAFVAIQEDSLCYDQIRSAEMMAYFDAEGQLARFDALGGATALFYLEENDVFATIYKIDTKMLSAIFENGEIDKVYNFEDVKNEDYPTAQMRREDRLLKGFSWEKELRPNGPSDITSLTLRESQREKYLDRPRPKFRQTNIYFPGYIDGVEKQIERSDSLRRVEASRPKEEDSTILLDPVDTLTVIESPNTLVINEDKLDVASQDGEPVVSVDENVDDTVSDAVSASEEEAAPEVDLKALKKQQQQEAKAARQAKKEARWAELDAKDARKAAAKEQKALEKKRKKTLRLLLKMDAANERDQKVLEKYQQKYQNKKARQRDAGKPVIDAESNSQDDVESNPAEEKTIVAPPADTSTLRTV